MRVETRNIDGVHQVSSRSRWIYAGNNARPKFKGIETCKDLCGNRYLMLHEVLYASKIWWNLVYVSIPLYVGFDLFFWCNGIKITLDNVLDGFWLCFIILYCNRSFLDYYTDRCVVTCYSSNNDIDVITWSARLGHIGRDRMNRLEKEGHVSPFTKIDMPTC